MDRIHLTSLVFFFFFFFFSGCAQAAKGIDCFSVSYALPRSLCLRKKYCFQGTNYDVQSSFFSVQQFCSGFFRRMWLVHVIPGLRHLTTDSGVTFHQKSNLSVSNITMLTTKCVQENNKNISDYSNQRQQMLRPSV